jgi:hypothetical protein
MVRITRMKLLLLTLLSVFIISCSDDDPVIDLGAPVIKFEAENGEYKVKKGKSVLLSATVENAVKPVYSWKLDGKIISTEPEFEFAGEYAGEYFINFRVDAENGHAEQQVKVSVLDKLPPEIDMPSMFIAYAGKDTEFTAEVLYAEEARYTWRLNGTVVSEEKTYVFNETSLGSQSLSLKVETEDGSDLKVFTITNLPVPVPELFFDNGHYRTPTNKDELRKMAVSIGKSLVLAPVINNIENPGPYQWTVGGVSQAETSEFFTFTPSAEGVYLITVTEQSTQAKAEVEVTCAKPESTYFRAKTGSSKATAANAFDYIPAPGQFINYQVGSTKARALNDLQNALNRGGAPYIGAYGGYWIVGFDHSVKNEEDKADLFIGGNAFPGWSEPGIVWVMQDVNGNGLPDDTWYELKGSETGKAETRQRYALTYYKPNKKKADVLWTDNFGGSNSVDYNGYHTQDYYFPMFIEEDYYTVVGTCLASSIDASTGIVYAKDLPWGYVDNYNTDTSRPGGQFRIEDAIQVDGSPANLTHIDFVKVHTGMAAKGSAVGEISTEPGIPTDLNF